MHQGPSTLRAFVNKLYYFSGKGHVVFWKCDYSIVFLISRRVRCITVFNALVRFNTSTFSFQMLTELHFFLNEFPAYFGKCWNLSYSQNNMLEIH